MNQEKKRTLAHFLMPAACLILGISTLAMLSGFEPFYSVLLFICLVELHYLYRVFSLLPGSKIIPV